MSIYEFLTQESPENHWIGRAIYYQPKYPMNSYRAKDLIPAQIDVVPDRHSRTGELPDIFWTWLCKKGLPALQKYCTKNWTSPSSMEVIEIISDCGKFVLKATPNGSYGYMYLGAYARVA